MTFILIESHEFLCYAKFTNINKKGLIMKIMLCLSSLGLILQPKINNIFNKVDLKEEFGITPAEFFNSSEELKVSSQKRIYFDNGIGYFISYKNKDNNVIGSILFEPINNRWEINSAYNGDYVPFENDQIYYVSPNKFVSLKDKINYQNVIYDDSNFGVTYESSVVAPGRYLHLKDSVSSHLQSYSSSYLQESKILNIPNYMNTRFRNKGCSVTTAAMYFAYFEDNGFDIINDKHYKNLPLKHTDDEWKVNYYIDYLGDNYFNTSYDYGTLPKNIVIGYNTYLGDNNLSNYTAHISKNYNEFKNAIDSIANPVHISLNEHSVLGIGYKEIHQRNGDITRLILTNSA